MDKPPRAWLDDRLVPHEAALVSASDPGFAVADGIFETLLAVNGRVPLLAEHLARFEASRVALALPAPRTDPAEAIRSLLAAEGQGGEQVVRLTLTARPTLIAMVRPLAERDRLRRTGLELFTLPERRGASFIARHKTLAWNANAVARRLHPAGASPRFEGLWLDPAGAVLEGTSANVFAVFGGVVHTPPLTAPILPGISRARVLRALGAAGIACVEAPLTRADLDRADELFATSSPLPVAPVVSLDGRVLAPGPMVALLRA